MSFIVRFSVHIVVWEEIFLILVSCKSKFHLVRVTSTRIRFFSITERIS